jgi:hypothetical protein
MTNAEMLKADFAAIVLDRGGREGRNSRHGAKLRGIGERLAMGHL